MKRLKKIFIAASKQMNRKILDLGNAKEHRQLFMRKKGTKSVKQQIIITYQPKVFENPSIVDLKSVLIEYPKTSHKLSETIRESEKGRF